MNSILEKIQQVPEERRQAALNWYLQKKARNMRMPITAYCELTPECNLSCKMCYSRLSHTEVEKLGGVRSVEEWKKWITESIELGVLNIVFTGGECLTYYGFDELYRYAYEAGARVAIMTNGVLMSKERVEMLEEMPPEMISMTMYGFSADTYGKACDNASAFEKAISAIERICDAKLPLQLKCTVTRDMVEDFDDIYHYAKAKGARFLSSNALMTNREACHRECDKLAVTDEEYFRHIKTAYGIDEERIIAPVIPDDKIPQKTKERGMQCGAGRSVYTINWRGDMIPCNVCDTFSVSLNECSIREAWAQIVTYSDQVPQLIECQACKFQNRCRQCVFLHHGDTGEFGKVSPRFCWKIKHPDDCD